MAALDAYFASDGLDDDFGEGGALDRLLGGAEDDSYETAAEAFGPSFGIPFADAAELDNMTSALRWTLHDECGDADDAQLGVALSRMFDAMTPAEGFDFGSALNQIGRGLSRALSDPTVAAVARTALPIAGGALGTVIGGPVGTALGSQLGTMVAGALPGHPAPSGMPARPGIPTPPIPTPPIAAPAVPAPGVSAPFQIPNMGMGVPNPLSLPPAPAPAQPVPASPVAGSPVAGGSAAAGQALALTQHPHVLQALLSAALGEHGRTSVGGLPVAQLLGMFSDILGQAAADADELHYLGGGSGEAESGWDAADDVGLRSLYPSLIDADNLELFTEAELMS
jgi:hypothetical protein